jgi:hypothetical protein
MHFAAAAMRQPYNGWAVGLSYHGSRKSFNSALQMLIFTASELQIRKNWGHKKYRWMQKND